MKRYFSLLLCAALCVGCLALTGCGTVPNPELETQVPTTTAPERGSVQSFKFDTMWLEITNVANKEERTGLDHGETIYQYTVFTLYPGAQLRVKNAGTGWYVSSQLGGEYIPITHDMPPLTITPDMGGVFQEGPARLVFKWHESTEPQTPESTVKLPLPAGLEYLPGSVVLLPNNYYESLDYRPYRLAYYQMPDAISGLIPENEYTAWAPQPVRGPL